MCNNHRDFGAGAAPSGHAVTVARRFHRAWRVRSGEGAGLGHAVCSVLLPLGEQQRCRKQQCGNLHAAQGGRCGKEPAGAELPCTTPGSCAEPSRCPGCASQGARGRPCFIAGCHQRCCEWCRVRNGEKNRSSSLFVPFLCIAEAEWDFRSDPYNAVHGSRSRRGLPATFCSDANAASCAVGFVLQVAFGWRWHKMGSLQWSRDSCEGAAVPGVGASRDARGCAAPLGPVPLQRAPCCHPQPAHSAVERAAQIKGQALGCLALPKTICCRTGKRKQRRRGNQGGSGAGPRHNNSQQK